MGEQMKIKELHKAKSDLIIDSNAKGSASSAQALSQNTKNDNGKTESPNQEMDTNTLNKSGTTNIEGIKNDVSTSSVESVSLPIVNLQKDQQRKRKSGDSAEG